MRKVGVFLLCDGLQVTPSALRQDQPAPRSFFARKPPDGGGGGGTKRGPDGAESPTDSAGGRGCSQAGIFQGSHLFLEGDAFAGAGLSNGFLGDDLDCFDRRLGRCHAAVCFYYLLLDALKNFILIVHAAVAVFESFYHRVETGENDGEHGIM